MRRLSALDPRDRAHPVVGVEIDDAHAHRVAALRRHLVGVDADHLALGGDDQHVVAARGPGACRPPSPLRPAVLMSMIPLPGAPLQPVLVERGALAVAALGDGEDLHAFLHDVGAR